MKICRKIREDIQFKKNTLYILGVNFSYNRPDMFVELYSFNCTCIVVVFKDLFQSCESGISVNL